MMGKGEKYYKVGLFGHYGQQNLGDEAVVLAAIQNLRDRFPNIELVGLSMNPADTEKRYNITTYPVRLNHNSDTKPKSSERPNKPEKNDEWFKSLKETLKKVIPQKSRVTVSGFLYLLMHLKSEVRFLREVKRQLRSFDALIICGSGQLEDFSGPWHYPYTILKWVLLAKASGTKVFILSVGAGPPSHSLSYWMYKKVLRKADYVSYRDHWTKQVFEGHTPKLKSFVYPDLAHGLKISPHTKNGHENYKSDKVVAINPMPAFDKNLMEVANKEKYETYIKSLAELIDHVFKKGFKVYLFNSHTSDLTVIDSVIERLPATITTNSDRLKVIRNDTVQELFNTLSKADMVVATRFHSILLPLLLNKPVLGLCYHTKSKEILDIMGLGNYYVDIYEFTDRELLRKFDLLFESMDAIEKELVSKYAEYHKSVDEQWDRLAELIKN